MPSDPTRRKRQLGRFMESLRRRQDPAMLPEALARAVDTSRPTISRMENGLQVPNKHLFVAILGALGVSREERVEALLLWAHAKQSAVRVQHAADLPSRYLAFRRDESQARREMTLNYAALPGLLQTGAYARAVVRAHGELGHSGDWLARAAQERLTRQRLLTKDHPLRLHSVISEAALRHAVGGPGVMAEQLDHLLMVSELENVTVQVVPFSAGAFGPMTGPVTILEFDEAKDPHSVYLEYPTGGETVEGEAETAAFVAVFHAAADLALPEEGSTALVRAALDEVKDRS